ncbi:CDP-alcohol phosphatidyltransferase family protein [Terrabacter sp. 2RAF25]|uniref:CDP-alcohol phosphatidyltransferase family protein n=1 Tax=Terrabacter sp. 2RAF25 TaxID=3232998 RepID=UPI003F974E1B
MRQVIPPGPVIGFVGVLGLLTALHDAADLGPRGWVAGLASGVVLATALAHGLVRLARRSLLPADRVTLTRAVLACGVAALVADPDASPVAVDLLVALSAVALVLDAVDGWVARRTGTASPMGARFDMETDAFLILVLSVQVARDLGWWVLGIGAARYVLLAVGAAGRWAPWLRGQVPARRWRKVVAAYQGIALTVAAAQALAPPLVTAVVAAGLGLLLVSFGTEVAALRRQALRPFGGAVPHPVPFDATVARAVR